MGRPAQSLPQLVRSGTFRARRHFDLLGDEPLPWPAFAALQELYVSADRERERKAIALDFEKLVREAHERAGQDNPALAEELLRLGPPGSADRAVGFFPRFLWHYAGQLTDKPFKLEPFQESWVRDLYERDKQGRRVYVRSLLGIAVGNGKTPLVAGLGLNELVDDLVPTPGIYALSGSREQAGADPHDLSRLHALARYWVEEGDLGQWVRAGPTLRCHDTRGMFKILPSDGRLTSGLNPSFALIEELSAFIYPAERAAYNAVSRRLGKRGSRMASVAAVTNAGWDKGTLLGEMYDAALKHPKLEVSADGCVQILRDKESGFLMHWYGAPEDADIENPKIVKACNPLSIIAVPDLLRDLRSPETDEHEWRRLHLSQWQKTKDAWLPAGVWARLRAEVQIPVGADIFVAVDAAKNYDTSAVAWAARLEDGRIALKTRVWSAREDAPHDVYVPGGRIRNSLLEDFIAEDLANRYHVREVVFDPRYFDSQGERLADRGFVSAEFPQNSATMADAWQHFYEAATGGTICHDGDEVFAKHVEAAAAVLTERGWKVHKLKSWSPIDALVAATMARERAAQPDSEPFAFLA